MADIAGGLGDISGAVGDLFGAVGGEQAAASYGKAASIASQNEALTLRSGQIQEQQEGIAITKALGGEEATTAGAGLSMSGSAVDLMRSSVQQGALSKQLLANQTEITAQGYAQQAAAYKGQQQAAQTQAAGKGIGGILGVAASAISIFSDRRLKTDIKFERVDGRFNIYSFRYVGDKNRFEGVMADEVREIMPEAVETVNGFLAVDYNRIGVRMVARG